MTRWLNVNILSTVSMQSFLEIIKNSVENQRGIHWERIGFSKGLFDRSKRECTAHLHAQSNFIGASTEANHWHWCWNNVWFWPNLIKFDISSHFYRVCLIGTRSRRISFAIRRICKRTPDIYALLMHFGLWIQFNARSDEVPSDFCVAPSRNNSLK